MKYLKSWSSHLKIRDKILIYSILLSALLTAVFIWVSSAYAQQSLQKNVSRVVDANATQVQRYLENIELTVSQSMSYTGTSITVQEYLTGNRAAEQDVQRIINEVANRDCIAVFELYDADGVPRLSSGEHSAALLSREVMEQSGLSAGNYWYDQPLKEGIAAELQVLQCVRRGDEILGYMRVAIQNIALDDIFSYAGFNMSSEIYVTAEDGKMLLPQRVGAAYYQAVRTAFQNYADTGMEQERYTYSDSKYIINCVRLREYKAVILIMTRTEEMQAELDIIRGMIYVMGGISLVLLIIVSLTLANVVSGPLIRLTEEVEQIGWGNLDLKVHEESYNEVGILSRTFNQMLERARSLLKEVERSEKRRRELELKVLQVQITPHFLHNSLESLSALSLIGDNETVYQMSKALGIFYRDVLSGGQDIISIRKEVAIIENYLLVQSIRYKDKFTYRINMSPNIESYRITKLTLQPLVENAIYHGVRELDYPGVIEISGGMEDGIIVLRVRDNGKGMAETMEELRKRRSKKDDHGDLILHRKGFGMSNVDERLRLYFGTEYGLTIISRPGEGTCVEARLPAVDRGRKTDDDISFDS